VCMCLILFHNKKEEKERYPRKITNEIMKEKKSEVRYTKWMVIDRY